tara:strand:+ start:2841 stop:3101 length:261 start_codon:yes stop_codon:yes gene_type:complete
MIEIHIPEVLDTGCFLESRFSQVMIKEDSGTTYSVQYLYNDKEDFKVYEQLHSEEIKNKTEGLFGGKYVAFRTTLNIIDLKNKKPL